MSNASAKPPEVSQLRQKYIEQGIIVPAKKDDGTDLSKASAKSSEASQPSEKTIEQRLIGPARKGEETNRIVYRDSSKRGDYADYYYSQALVHQQDHRYDEARKLFGKAIQTLPKRKFFDTYARMEKELEQIQLARNIFRRAIKAFPQDGMFYESYAMLERYNGRFRQAANILRKGLKEASTHTILHLYLAQVLMELDDNSVLEEAERHFESAQKFGFGMDEGVVSRGRDTFKFQLKVLQGPPRGHDLFKFLPQAGFEITDVNLQKGYAIDFVIKPLQTEDWESYDLTGEIFVRCFYQDTISYQNIHEAIKHVHSDNSHDHLSQNVLFVMLATTDKLRDYLYQLLEKPERNPTVVPLEDADIRRAVKSGHGKETLQRILDQWLYRRNLYKENYPVSGLVFRTLSEGFVRPCLANTCHLAPPTGWRLNTQPGGSWPR